MWLTVAIGFGCIGPSSFAIILDPIMNFQRFVMLIFEFFESRLYQHSLRQRSCAKQELHVLPEAPAVAIRLARHAPVGRTLAMHQVAAATQQDSTAIAALGWLIGFKP
jgi:hypothetical protein